MKNELLASEDFKVYLKMIKLRIPKMAIMHKLTADGIFDPKVLDLFDSEIEKVSQGLPVPW